MCTVQAGWPALMAAQYSSSISKSVFWSTETEEGGSIMWCGRAPTVCLSNLYMWSVQRRKFCWMAHCDWPLLTSWGGRKHNQISSAGIMFFCVNAANERYSLRNMEVAFHSSVLHSCCCQQSLTWGIIVLSESGTFGQTLTLTFRHCRRKTLGTTDGAVKRYKNDPVLYLVRGLPADLQEEMMPNFTAFQWSDINPGGFYLRFNYCLNWSWRLLSSVLFPFTCTHPMKSKQRQLRSKSDHNVGENVFDHWHLIHGTQPKSLITDTRRMQSRMTSPRGIMGCCAPLVVCATLRRRIYYLALMHARTVSTCVWLINHLQLAITLSLQLVQSLLSPTNIYSPNCTASPPLPPPQVNRALSSPGNATLFVLFLQEVLGSVCPFER